MARLLSVSLTESAVVARTKTVTRRLGWRFLKPGDRLTLCLKVMGRKRKDGTVEPLVRLADVEVVSVRREPLHVITQSDVWLEGFTDMDEDQFIDFFCRNMRCQSDTEVTRIEWLYLPEVPEAVGCCALEENHDGPCAIVCPQCQGTQRCRECDDQSVEDLAGCGECGSAGGCTYCYEGLVTKC